jgi:predicted ATP-dependent protease
MNLKSRELKLKDIDYRIPDRDISRCAGKGEASGIIGQPRALAALTMGTEIKSKGYNIFVSGQTGTGRRTAIKKVLNDYPFDRKILRDIAYVYNFSQPDRPKPLYLKPGNAQKLKKGMHELVEYIKKQIEDVFDSENFKNRRDSFVAKAERRENKLLTKFESRLSEDGFEIVNVQNEQGRTSDIVPVIGGEAVSFSSLQAKVINGEITESNYNALRERYYKWADEMKTVFQNLEDLREDLESDMEVLRNKMLKPLILEGIEKLQKDLDDEGAEAYLKEASEDIQKALYLFFDESEDEEEPSHEQLARYGVNVLVDHAKTAKVPALFENHPNYTNLFGTIEYKFDKSSETKTNHLMIRPGALVQASWGFLVLRAQDLLQDESCWLMLKRCIEGNQVEIQPPPSQFMNPMPLLKPEPVRVEVKIIIIGSPGLYELLYTQDPDFQKFFKIPAEFDSVLTLNDDAMAQYVSFIRETVKKDQLTAFSNSGIAAVIEYAKILAEHRQRLSTRFSHLADIIRESSYWAGKAKHPKVSREDVRKALDERRYLYNLSEEKIDEMIIEGELNIQTSGSAIGQVNGLAVLDRGYFSFGKPCQISCRTAPGSEGLIDIEDESGLSGEIHVKGMHILEGLLRSRYQIGAPLSLHATVCFEQSYSEIDGDSASAAEFCTILSSLARLPARQDIAMTGSINQNGAIQTVGGITEKIEGFYNICRKRGLAGTEGVIFPYTNINGIMLNADILKAIGEGKFHLYPVRNINEALEILTGLPAGNPDKDGRYKGKTVHAMVQDRLEEFALCIKDFQS